MNIQQGTLRNDNIRKLEQIAWGPLLFVFWLISTLGLWFFAFYHLPEGTPEWVARAQAACFGRAENGLPDTAGWLILIGSPLSILIALFFLFGEEFLPSISALLRTRSGLVCALILAGLTAVQTSWTAARIKHALGLNQNVFSVSGIEPFPESYPELMRPLPNITLTDQSGAAVTLNRLPGKTTIITFVFAHCSTVCPLLVRNVNQTIKDLPADKVAGLMITLDPWRDTVGSLPEMAKRWELAHNVHLLSGQVQEVEAALSALDVARQRDQKTGDVVHPALVYIADGEGRIVYGLNNPSTAWLKQAAERVISSQT